MARSLADGPWFAHGVTKTMMNQEWAMGIDEMIESKRRPKPFAWRRAIFAARSTLSQTSASRPSRGMTMITVSSLSGPTREHLDWPFFDKEHRSYVE